MKRRKLLLLSPPAEGLNDQLAYPPLGLLYVASNLPEDVWDVDVKVMADGVLDLTYPYYGISVHSLAVVKNVRKIIDRIKTHNKNAEIMLGGSAAPMITWEKQLAIYEGQFEHWLGITDIDKIKLPAREKLPYEYIHYTGPVHHSEKPSTTMIATRGCPYSCAFCDRTTIGRNFRTRSTALVGEEIELLKHDYEIQHIRFIDDCITLNRKWFEEFLNMMGNRKVTWTCLSRADCLDRELLVKMRDTGCTEVFFGFESGSQRMLDAMHKQTTVEKNKRIIALCKDVGIKCCAYMMFGFPGENELTVDETLRFLDETKPDKSRLSTYVPIPNTDVWNSPSKYNVSLNKNYEDFWYYDNDRLGLTYNYVDQATMLRLRTRMLKYYQDNFVESWTK